jgi:trimethylamine--corrinoid protein Co-methyltransferase
MFFEPLSKKDLETIHVKSLEILAGIGVNLQGRRAREVLLSAGCKEKGGRICFPPALVEDALKDPAPVTVYGMDDSIKIPLTGVGRSYSHNFGTVFVLLDPESGQIREATVRDLEEYVWVSDNLPYLDKVVPSLWPRDLPETITTLAGSIYAMRNTRKPVDMGLASTPWEARKLIEIAATVRGGMDRLKRKPMGTISISTLSPLHFPEDISETIFEVAGTGLPLTMLPCPISGLTAPVTLVGGFVQQNAEQLAFLTLARLVNRGCPLVYASRLCAADMRTGFVSGNNLVRGFSGACAAQMARYYGLPSAVYGMDTAAARPDIQSGYERALNCLLPVLAGGTLISGFGALNGGTLASIEQLVIDNEIYGMVMHRCGGLTVDEETIGVDVIKAVMDGGNFLAQEHTRDFMRKGELWQGDLGNALPFEEWRAQGCPDIREAARAKVREIAKTYSGPYLDEKLCRELDLILERVKAERAG